MRRAGLFCLGAWFAASCALSGCGSDTPTLPGEFLGTFLFSGTMEFGDGGTTCLVDGGNLYQPTTLQFYAEVSLLPDSGVLWLLPSPQLSVQPVEGGASGDAFTVVTNTQALVSGCGCTASLVETVSLVAPGDGGLVPGLAQLTGTLDDRLDPDPDAGFPLCSGDAGAGCGLACDLVFSISGVPGRP